MAKTGECALEVDQDHGEEIPKGRYSHMKVIIDHYSRVYSFAFRERRVGGVLKSVERKRNDIHLSLSHRDRNFF